jgi:Tol biopolymer transport system component
MMCSRLQLLFSFLILTAACDFPPPPAIIDGGGSDGSTTDAQADAPTEDAGSCRLQLAYESNGDIYVAAADGTGVTNVTTSTSREAQPAWGPNVIVFQSNRVGEDEIFAVDATGSQARNLTEHPAADRNASVSPDGTHVAFTRRGDDGFDKPWVMMLNGTQQRQLSSASLTGAGRLAWSPDSTRIAYNTVDGDVFVVALDGSTQTNLCTWTTDNCVEPSWSPDGTQVALDVLDGPGDIYLVDVTNPARGMNLTNTPDVAESVSSWAPAETLALYRTAPGSVAQLFALDIRGAPGTGPRPIPVSGSAEMRADTVPLWSPDGRKLVFSRWYAGVGNRVATIDADGANFVEVTQGSGNDPAWAPCQ